MSDAIDWRTVLAALENTDFADAIDELLDMGMSINQMAAEVGCDNRQVRNWRDQVSLPGLVNGVRLLALRDSLRAVADLEKKGGAMAEKKSGAMKGRRAVCTVYIEPENLKRLRKLSERTRIPQAALWREALSDLLAKHQADGEKSATK